jgi:HAD superfamily hydrolase (TIGR01509 family)
MKKGAYFKGAYFFDKRLQSLLERARLVIFDMNGLIIDDEAVQLRSVNMALAPYGINLSEEYWIEHCIGKRADQYFKFILEEILKPEEFHQRDGLQGDKNNRHTQGKGESLNTRPDVSEIVAKKNRIYHSLISGEVKNLIRPGVRELLSYLSKSPRHVVALATSAHPPEIETILGEGGLNLKHLFKFIISGIDVVKSKPHPEAYEKLSNLAGFSPHHCLVIEDSSTGVTAAVRAGMPCLAVPNRFTQNQDFSSATYTIDNLTKHARIIGA